MMVLMLLPMTIVYDSHVCLDASDASLPMPRVYAYYIMTKNNNCFHIRLISIILITVMYFSFQCYRHHCHFIVTITVTGILPRTIAITITVTIAITITVMILPLLFLLPVLLVLVLLILEVA